MRLIHAVGIQAKGRHLVAYAVEASGERRPVAYLHYRWELDPPKEERRKGQPVYAVAYVYELQLAEDARGKGLGSHLMSLLETRVRSPLVWAGCLVVCSGALPCTGPRSCTCFREHAPAELCTRASMLIKWLGDDRCLLHFGDYGTRLGCGSVEPRRILSANTNGVLSEACASRSFQGLIRPTRRAGRGVRFGSPAGRRSIHYSRAATVLLSVKQHTFDGTYCCCSSGQESCLTLRFTLCVVLKRHCLLNVIVC